MSAWVEWGLFPSIYICVWSWLCPPQGLDKLCQLCRIRLWALSVLSTIGCLIAEFRIRALWGCCVYKSSFSCVRELTLETLEVLWKKNLPQSTSSWAAAENGPGHSRDGVSDSCLTASRFSQHPESRRRLCSGELDQEHTPLSHWWAQK
jgi:hypothetical protein